MCEDETTPTPSKAMQTPRSSMQAIAEQKRRGTHEHPSCCRKRLCLNTVARDKRNVYATHTTSKVGIPRQAISRSGSGIGRGRPAPALSCECLECPGIVPRFGCNAAVHGQSQCATMGPVWAKHHAICVPDTCFWPGIQYLYMSSVGPHGSQILKTKKSRIRCLGTASWTASTRGRCGRFRTGLTVIPLYVIGLAQWVTNTTNRQSRTRCICARPPGWQVVAMQPIRRCIDHWSKLPMAGVQSPQNCTTSLERCQVIVASTTTHRT